MVFPTSLASAVLLLLLSFLCFSFWPNLYKRSERNWRFELFCSGFLSGRYSGRAAHRLHARRLRPGNVFHGPHADCGARGIYLDHWSGCVFTLGNMLLLASITLLGMAPAFAASFGTAIAVTAAIYIGPSHPLLLAARSLAFLLCVVSGLERRS